MYAARSSTTHALPALATLVGMSLAGVSGLVAQEPAGDLKWTPHRASRPAGDAPAAEPSAADRMAAETELQTEAEMRTSPPASVSLPDGVPPAVSPMTGRREAAYTPPRRQPPRPATPTGATSASPSRCPRKTALVAICVWRSAQRAIAASRGARR